MKLLAFTLFALAGAVSGQAALLYDINPAAGGGSFGGFNGNWGFNFSLASATTFDAVGLWDEGSNGLAGPHQVGIFNSSGGSALASGTVDNSSIVVASANANGRWLFTAISPITLNAGTYTLGFFNPSSGVDDFRGNATGDFMSGASFGGAKARSGAASFAWPDANSPISGGWFGPNLRTGQAAAGVPEPGSCWLLGLGLAIAGWRVRRG